MGLRLHKGIEKNIFPELSPQSKNFKITQKMTATNFHETASLNGFPGNMVPSPQGWVTTGIHIINVNSLKEQPDAAASQYDHNLSLAAKHTERLIDALKEGLDIEVFVSYMRVETEMMFHILLLIGGEDFHSSKIIAARILAEEFEKTEGYKIKFVFAIESENRMRHVMKFGGYKLMFRRKESDNEAN